MYTQNASRNFFHTIIGNRRRFFFQIALTVFLFISCQDFPTNPRNATNSDVKVVLIASNGQRSDKLNDNKIITDSVGKDVKIEAILILPEFMKETKVEIFSSSNISEFDSVFYPATTNTLDTIKIKRKLTSLGEMKIVAASFLKNGTTKIDSVKINVLGQSIINQPPSINVTTNKLSIKPDEACSLKVAFEDNDTNQTHLLTVTNNEHIDTVKNNFYIWKAPTNFAGKDTLIFKVTDNGTPSLSSTKEIVIDVLPGVPSIPEHLRIVSRSSNSIDLAWDNAAGAEKYVVYKSNRSDSGFIVLSDTLTSTKYTDKIDTLTYYYYVKALNTTGESAPSEKVSTKDTGNIAPEWDSDTLYVNLESGSKYTLNLNDTCNDPNRDALTFTLISGSTAAGTITGSTYSFTPSDADTGIVTVRIAAKDPGNLSDTLSIKFTITSGTVIIDTDTTAPELTFYNPATDTATVNTAEFPIKIVCKDSSGIKSLTCKSGNNEFKVDKTNDTLYTAVVSNLVQGQFTEFTFTAVDASKKGNTSSIIVKLKYDPSINKKFIIKFNSQGGSKVDDQTVIYGGKATSPTEPVKTGYTFGGWYKEAECKTIWTFATDVVTGDATLFAKWTANVYTVTFDGQGATVAPNPTSKNVTVPATTVDALPTEPKRDGFTLGGWWTSGGTQFLANTVVTANIIVLAKWIEIPKSTVTFFDDGATTPVSPSIVIVTTNSTLGTLLPTAPKKKSYTFSGWYTGMNGGGTEITANSKITKDIALYAWWRILDADGNEYHEIQIGNQVWMVENLKTTKFKDGTMIPQITDGTAWGALTTPAFCYYNNILENKDKYGALYNWNTVNTGKLAPDGWHVPTDAEWDTLQNYFIANGYNWDNTTTGNKIAKSLVAKTDWNTYTGAGAIGSELTNKNLSGFSALWGGCRYSGGGFDLQSLSGHWWSATEYGASSAWYRYLTFSSDSLHRDNNNKRYGYSVRLVKD